MSEIWSPQYAGLFKSLCFDFGFLIWPLVLILCLKNLKAIRKVAFFMIFIILVMGTKPFAYGLKSSLGFLAKDDDLTSCQAEAIVVLTGGAINEATPSISTQLRLQKAAALARTWNLPLVITGGSVELPVAESEIAARFLEQSEHLPKTPIYVERESLNTHQNAVYSRELLERFHLRPEVILVTSPWHMLRSSLVFKHAGFKVCRAASPSEYINPWQISYKNGMSSFSALNEVFGLAGYLSKGWL
ncbi:MAG: YdcF family protein [Pseudomonadota bacterium]